MLFFLVCVGVCVWWQLFSKHVISLLLVLSEPLFLPFTQQPPPSLLLLLFPFPPPPPQGALLGWVGNPTLQIGGVSSFLSSFHVPLSLGVSQHKCSLSLSLFLLLLLHLGCILLGMGELFF